MEKNIEANTENTSTLNKNVVFCKKLLFYVGGMSLIAIGIIISKQAGLGISPVSAVPFACEKIWGIELGLASSFFYSFCKLYC